MSDPLDQLKQWREITESDNYADLVDLAREATPALLTAVENVLKLHRELANSSSALYPVPLCACGSGYPCLTVDAIRDALGGTK